MSYYIYLSKKLKGGAEISENTRKSEANKRHQKSVLKVSFENFSKIFGHEKNFFFKSLMTLPCNTCRMRFESRALLTEHYHSDLHRTNLVLKSRGQDPLTEAQFIALQKKKEEEALANAPPPPPMPVDDEEEDKEEFNYELCRDIPDTECLFCGKEFENADLCLEHMASHGFRFCYPDKLSDKAGLLAYLGEKIGVGHCCPSCSRQFQSLKSLRNHMKDKCHCNYEYDEEVEEFYHEEMGIVLATPGVIDSVGELHLPNGKIYGHRAYARYYKQKQTDAEALKRTARRAIAGPEAPRETIDIAKDRIMRIREFYKQKYISKKMMRLTTKDYHPFSDMRRGNAV